MLMTHGAVEVLGRVAEERSARVMMVVGLPMLGELPRPGMLANVNDEDDHADHPRRSEGCRSLGWV